MTRTIEIQVPGSGHRLHLAPGLRHGAGAIVHATCPSRSAFLIVDAAVSTTHGDAVDASLHAAGYEITRCEITATEQDKSVEVVSRLHGAMVAARHERSSPVITVGGGITTDLGGFAAATYLRGVPVIHVPSTLLGMVDAAVGGKTGVNHPLPGGRLGKNLIGAFWQPSAIIVDPEMVLTLDPRHLRCGFAECVKHAVLTNDPALRDMLHDEAGQLLTGNPPDMETLIDHAVRIKISLVEEDARESGRRELLNLGHTFAHAIESVETLDLFHGEAVSIGLVAAGIIGEGRGTWSGEEQARLVDLLGRLDLPTALPHPVPAEDLVRPMAWDKKVRDRNIRLVLPCTGGGAEIIEDIRAEEIDAAWHALGAPAAS